MNTTQNQAISFIQTLLTQKNDAFITAQEQALFTENKERRYDIIANQVNEVERQIDDINGLIDNLSTEIHALSTSTNADFDLHHFQYLRHSLTTKRQEKDGLLGEHLDLQKEKKDIVELELDVKTAAKKFPKNRYQHALDVLLADHGEKCVSMANTSYFLDCIHGLETLMLLLPVTDFEIGEMEEEVGIYITSLTVAGVELTIQPYVIRTEVETWHNEIQSEEEIRKIGFDTAKTDASTIRKAFSPLSPSFEWFQALDRTKVIEVIFLNNPASTKPEEDYLYIAADATSTTDTRIGEGFVNGMKMGFSRYPNFI